MKKGELDLLRRQVEELKTENVMLQQKLVASRLHTPSDSGSEELLNATQRLSKVGGWEWNVEKQTMFWTEETYRIHDFVQGELVPGSPELIEKSLACYDPADRLLIHNAFLKCAERGEPYDYELPFTTAAGRKLWVRTTAQPLWDNDRIVSVVGNIMDITDRKSAQEQLAESERKLSTLMANLPGMAYRCLNDEFWTMKFVSDGCFELTGLQADHLIDNQRTSYADLIHPDDRVMVYDTIQSSLAKREQFNLTYRIFAATGKEKWVLEKGQGVFTDTGELAAIEGFITDITERRRSEEALRLSEEKFRLAFQTSPDSINLNRLSDGMYIDINEGFTKLMGFTWPDVVGKTSVDLNIWVDPADRDCLVQSLQKDGYVENLEARFRRKNGQIGTGLMSARVLRLHQEDLILSITRDITERKQVEDALRESEDKYSQLVESLTDAILVWSTEEIKYANPAAFKLFNAKKEEDLIGKRYLDFVHPDDRLESIERIKKSRTEKWIAPRREHRMITADGQVIHVESTGVPIQSQGRIQHFGIFNDISERKLAEEELRIDDQRMEALLQLNQMHHASLQEIASYAMEEAVRLTRSRIGYLAFINQDESVLNMYAWSRSAMKECGIDQKTRVYPVADTGLWGETVRQRKAIITNDYKSPNLHKKGFPKGHVNLERHLGVPIFDNDRIVIVAGVGDKGSDYSERDIRQIELLMSGMWRIVQRKQAENALRHSEARFRTAFENASVGITLVSLDGIYQEVNEAMARIIGYRPADLIGKPVATFTHPEDLGCRSEFLGDLVSGRIASGSQERRFIHRNGSVVQTLIWANVQRDQDGAPLHFISLVQDITERKRAEEELKENLLFLRQTERIARMGGWKANIKTDELKWTEGVHHLTGVPLDYRPSLEEGLKFYDSDSIPVIKAALAKTLEDGSPFKIIAMVITKSGKQIWAEVRGLQQIVEGEKAAVVGTFQDITERVLAEEHIKETEKKYRDLAESLPQIIFEVDLNGTLRYVNQTGLQLFGYTKEEVVNGFNVMDVFIPEDRERLAANIMGNIQGQIFGRQDYTAVRKDGTTFPVGAHASPVMSGKTATGLRGILIDLTATQQAKEEKKKLEIQLQQAQKMEAIGALAGGIAHDFNNILSAIIGYTELAMLNEGAEHCTGELNEALTAANRAKDLVKQILAFSRQTDEDRMPVRVGLVAKEALKFLRATIPTTIEIKTRIDDKSGAVFANSVELHQIIMNLCTNAHHAIGDQAGCLEVVVENTEIEPSQKNDLIDLEIGSYVKISIKDTGHGMSSDVITKIFDPYFTTKDKGVGTGLGLAVVHGIVKKYGGAIRVESQLGKGTTFHIYLPKANIAAPINTDQPKSIIGGSERILFVDDEKMLVAIGQQTLERLGYNVVSRTSPIEALELFKAKPDHFDLVITDQTMPGMTGDALARELMGINPNLPIIICTGYSHTIDQERAKQIGVKAFVMKPILIHEIAAAVRQVLDKG